MSKQRVIVEAVLSGKSQSEVAHNVIPTGKHQRDSSLAGFPVVPSSLMPF